MAITDRPDHYEAQCEEWRRRFLTLNPSELLQKIPGLTAQGEYLTLTYYHRSYGICRTDGTIVCFEDEKPPALFTRMNIYTLLWYCKPRAAFQGVWLPFRSLKDASPYGPAFQRTITDVFAKTFSGRVEALKEAARRLGGKELTQGDAGFELDSFACIPVRFFFWDGDDEFPAQANILFDRGAVDFIHVEMLVTIADEGVRLLRAYASDGSSV